MQYLKQVVKMEIIEDKENFLLNRKEIKIVVEAEKTPSLEEALNIVSENFKAEKDLIVINQVKGKFGRNTFLISAFIYKNKEDKDKLEGVKKKKKEQEEKKEGESSGQAQKQNQPAEEKKETEGDKEKSENESEGKGEDEGKEEEKKE